MDKIKVLHIITGLNTGGAERMLVKLIDQTQRNMQHTVISLKDKGTQGGLLEDLGVKLFTIGVAGSVPSLAQLFKIRKLIKEICPDVIQGWMYHGNLAALVNGFSVPIVFNIRHSLSDINKEKLTTQWVIKLNSFFSKKASKVVYNSRLSSVEHEAYGFVSSKTIILPNGFDLSVFNIDENQRKKKRNELNLKDNHKVFCQIGRHHPMKNHIGFIKAASKVLKENKNSQFILVGRDVDKDEELKQLVLSLNIKDNITLLGERNDIPEIWNAVDFGVLSSVWGEGFPNVVGEAMACGKPCIVTDVGDAAFIVDDTGIVIKPLDIDTLANAMFKMISLNPFEIESLSMKARQRIVDNFSIEKISKDYTTMYKKLLRDF